MASLSPSQPATLLGWFVCRSGTQLAASAREQVCGGVAQMRFDRIGAAHAQRFYARQLSEHTCATETLSVCKLVAFCLCCVPYDLLTSKHRPRCLQAVSTSLAGALSRRQKGHRSDTEAVPLLFALCSAGQQQGGATCSFQYRFFQLSQVGRFLVNTQIQFHSDPPTCTALVAGLLVLYRSISR